MTYKTWVVGAGEGSIGETIADVINTNSGRMTVHSTAMELDVREWNRLDNFVEEHGPFDWVVYCAGIPRLEWIKDANQMAVENVFETNVGGFIGVMKALVNYQSKGNVVVLSSDAARVPMRGSIAYCSSKAALSQAVRVAARELAPGWRINAISPAMVDDTNMTAFMDEMIAPFRGWEPEFARQYEESMVPMGRRATKKEIAQLVLDILKGPQFMTGSIVDITGGK